MRGRRRVGTGVLGLLLVLLAAAPAGAATLPPGFTDERVAAVGAPTALAFLPDGTPLVATQPGRLVALEGTGRRTLLDLGPSACTGSERGLLGIAVDPAHAAGRRALYAFWTRRGDGGACDASAVNRISRFPVRADGTADRAGEVVLVDRMPSPAGNHNGGDLAFGRDGLLYATIGDGGCDWAGDSGCAGANDAARDRHVLTGKVLRVTADGAVPAGNPFAATGGRCATTGRTEPGRHCAETFAWGLRNPFRLAFDPDAAGTRFFVNDVGQNAWEEIDEGRAGADYGWNAREGRCRTGSTTECGPPPPGLTDPVHAYGRGTGCASITGGAFVPDGVWPAAYDRDYLFADYVCGTIFRLTPRPGGGFDQAPFVTGLGTSSAVHLAFGPHAGTRALFYTTYAGGGEVRRITHTGSANRAPVARLAAAPVAGPAPLRTTLSAAGSSDPDGDALTHLWSFGDGTADAATDAPSVAHTYARPGAYTATLRVRDARGAVSEPATVRIDAGNAPPVPRITAPGDELRFRVGQAITLRGEATDAEDGAVPAARLSWRIVRRHADHTHPFLSRDGAAEVTFTAPGPEDTAAAATSYLVVELTATDARGATRTVTRDLRPNLVPVTIATDPPGLAARVNDLAVTGPATLTSWEGFALDLSAAEQTAPGGRVFAPAGWSDGGAARHTAVTPAEATTFTARFAEGPTGLRAERFDGLGFTGPRVTGIDPVLAFDWGAGAPDPALSADTFSVRWTGSVVARHSETHRFTARSDDGIRVWVDGRLVIDAWSDHGPRDDSGTVDLVAGRPTPIRVEYYERAGRAVARLSWSSARQPLEVVPRERLRPAPEPAAAGFRTELFAGRDLTGPALVRTDPVIDHEWGPGGPAAGIGADDFSVRWTGTVRPASTEPHTFTVRSDDGVRLWVDDRLVIDAWDDHAVREDVATVALTAGRSHAVRLEFYEHGGHAVARLSWRGARQAEQVVPAEPPGP